MTGQSWWGVDLLQQRRHDWVTWATPNRQVLGTTLSAEVAKQTRILDAHGVRGGDTVALHGTPSLTQLWCLLALWSRGVQVLLFEQGLSKQEQADLLRVCRPRFLITLGGWNHRGRPFVDECEVLVRRLPNGLRERSSHCVVQLSSGTTGAVKIVGRSSESLLIELDRLRMLGSMPVAGERVALLDSVTHSFGLIGGVLHGLNCGTTTIFPSAPTSKAIAEAAATAHVVIGTPQRFAQLLAADPSVKLERMRLAISSGEVLPGEVFESFYRRFGVRIGQAYGTTETGIVATDLVGAFGPPNVGLPVPGLRTRISEGVLEVHVPHSPYLFRDNPWPGGWLSTNDLVSENPATGALRLRGRVEHQPGTDLDLLEIESVLRAHRHVTDAVVLGDDPVEAHLAASADIDLTELQSWCRRFLNERAVPGRYHVVGKLPRTSSGKVLRQRLSPVERVTDPHIASLDRENP